MTGIKPFILTLKMITSFTGDLFILIDPQLNIIRYFNTLHSNSVEIFFDFQIVISDGLRL